MLKQTTLISFLGLSLMACGGTTTPVNSNAANTANTNTAKPANTANTAAPTNAPANTNTPANSTAAKPASNEPKRLNFPKGTTNTIEYFDLEPGEAKQFVVGAAKGQNLVVDNGGDGSQITLITKGKTVDVTNEGGRLDATTTAGGDFVFEVKNTGKAKLKASINVMIENIGDD
ncbi:MAG: hypothetical protein K1X72_06355 [Pyrinomonadaceae bacterium]|nr:hypothetical protein [Pyrinomonadaceae bacterium]